MTSRLKAHLDNVHQLRLRLDELRADIEAVSAGMTIYYAVDFSELHAYLHEDEKPFGVGIGLEEDGVPGLINQRQVKEANQHRLGLAHLFHTLTPTVYLLPPHTLELWYHARN